MSKYWKIFIGCVVALLAVMFLLVLYAVEKPDPTVDYFTQYNDLTRPDPYDPKQDAAEVLKKLPEPDYADDESDLDSIAYQFEIADYPDKLSPEDLQKVEKWLMKNQPRLEAIIAASRKPYYYRPVDASAWKTETLEMSSYMQDFDYDFWDISRLLSWATVYHLHKGDIETSIRCMQASLDFYRMLRPQAGYYQQYEIASFVESLTCLFDFMQNQEFSPDALAAVQKMLLTAELDCHYDDAVVRLSFYDFVQKFYTPGDHGHLAPAAYINKEMGGFDWDSAGEILQSFYEAFNGERRKKVVDRMETVFARLNELKDLPASRRFADGVNLQSEMEALAGDNRIVKQQLHSVLSRFQLPYQSVCTLHALAAATAVERYRRDKGQYPESLEILLAEGFIDRLPEDAFSGKPLIYRRQDEGFLLYSVGIDGADDGGLPALCRNCGNHLTDWGDGPVYRAGGPAELNPADPKDAFADHIFWPTMEMDPGKSQLAPAEIFKSKTSSGDIVF